LNVPTAFKGAWFHLIFQFSLPGLPLGFSIPKVYAFGNINSGLKNSGRPFGLNSRPIFKFPGPLLRVKAPLRGKLGNLFQGPEIFGDYNNRGGHKGTQHREAKPFWPFFPIKEKVLQKSFHLFGGYPN